MGDVGLGASRVQDDLSAEVVGAGTLPRVDDLGLGDVDRVDAS